MFVQNLTDKEKNEFCEHFYELANEIGLDDRDSPSPWGCPWLWEFEYEKVNGLTIKDMAAAHYKKYKNEIIECLKEKE